MPRTLNQLWSRQDQTEKCQELLANKKFVSTLKWRSVGHILITLISFFALIYLYTPAYLWKDLWIAIFFFPHALLSKRFRALCVMTTAVVVETIFLFSF